ncbi:MAG: hypothetical protein ACOCWR_02635, partial [Oceanidesulfovibrio sp.]
MSQENRPGRSPHPIRMALAATSMAAACAVWAFVLLGFSVAALLLNPADTVPYAVQLAAPGSHVQVERFEIVSAWPLTLELHRMQVHGQDGDEIFAVERATIMADPRSGWQDGLWIRKMELHGPRAAIRATAENGTAGDGDPAVWNPESLRGLFFYKEVHCTNGAFILHAGNRTIEARELAFSLRPVDDADADPSDATLRTASLNATVRVSEAGAAMAEARLHGEGEVRADRFTMEMRVADGRVDTAGAAGAVGGRAEFVLTPETLDVDNFALDFTPADEFRQRTGIEGAVHLQLGGRLVLDESRYELRTLVADLPETLTVHGNATGGFDSMPSTATFRLHAPALGAVLEQARPHVAALEAMQGEGGPVSATLRIDPERVRIDIHAENATMRFGADRVVTARALHCNGTTPRGGKLEALVLGDSGSLETLAITGAIDTVA